MTINQSIFTGVAIGGSASAALFLTVPAYHDYIMWQFASPWTFVIGAALGITLAVVTD